jgi:hypothetical protein
MCRARPAFSNMIEGQFATGTTQATRIFTGSARAPVTATAKVTARSAARNFVERIVPSLKWPVIVWPLAEPRLL